jgi:lipopolysaccharide transport system permease protein
MTVKMSKMPKITVIEAGRPAANFWRELWEYRELLYLLAWRDISVRYKQTALGIAWALIRPLFTTLVFVFVFAFIARIPSGETPYTLLVLAGLLPWQLISGAVSSAGESLIGNSNMLSKVYFPRLLFPLSAVATALVDFLVGLGLFLLVMAWYGTVPTWRVVAIVPLVLVALGLAVGVGTWLSAANVKYRDFRYVVPFLVQLGMYVSPVGYPTSLVPQRWQLVYALNPAVGIIDGFRWALLGEPYLDLPALAISCAFAGGLLSLGLAYFHRVEKSITDVL